MPLNFKKTSRAASLPLAHCDDGKHPAKVVIKFLKQHRIRKTHAGGDQAHNFRSGFF